MFPITRFRNVKRLLTVQAARKHVVGYSLGFRVMKYSVCLNIMVSALLISLTILSFLLRPSAHSTWPCRFSFGLHRIQLRFAATCRSYAATLSPQRGLT